MPDRLGRYLRAHVEELFVASVLGVTLLLFLLIPYKLAFLNFFYLPVFVAGFFWALESRSWGASSACFWWVSTQHGVPVTFPLAGPRWIRSLILRAGVGS